MTQYEREEKQLERDYHEGKISRAQHNRELRDLEREYRDQMRDIAEDAAERAYNDTIGGW